MKELITQVDQFTELLNAARAWIKKYRSDEWERLFIAFEEMEDNGDVIKRAASRKTSIGLYGESQVGKSYLVNALLSPKLSSKNNLLIKTHPEAEATLFDAYNPKKESEATAVVTRFTRDTHNTFKQGYYKTELITPTLLFTSLNRGFDLEIKPEERSATYTDLSDQGAVKELLERIRRNSGRVLSAKSSRAFRIAFREAVQFKTKRDFFLDANEALKLFEDSQEPLSIDCVTAAASILWLGFDNVSEFFRQLLENLVEWGEPESVYLPETTLKQMLDTDYMKGYGNSSMMQRCMLTLHSAGHLVFDESASGRIDLSILQFLSSEVILHVTEDGSDLLTHVDMLDFPGIIPFSDNESALTREDATQNKSILYHLMKMGKLKELFIQYTSDLDVNYLLLCIAMRYKHISQLNDSVSKWVNKAFNPAEALFTVMTKSDEILKLEASNDLANERWSARFGTHFEETHQWLKDVKSYSNVYLIRNVTASTYDIVGKESLETYKQSYLNHPKVNQYLSNRVGTMWNALVDPNNGGVLHLHDQVVGTIENQPNMKAKDLAQRLLVLKQNLYSELKSYYVPESEEEKAELLQQQALDFLKKMEEKNRWDRNLVNLLTTIDDHFPPFSSLLKHELDEEEEEPIFEDYFQEADLLKLRLLNQFESDLLKNSGNICRESLKGIEVGYFKQFVKRIIHYLRNHEEKIQDYIDDNEALLSGFAPEKRLLFHEAMHWICISGITHLWEIEVNENPIPTLDVRRVYPHNDLKRHWHKRLPLIYAVDSLDDSTAGNDDLKILLKKIDLPQNDHALS